MTPDLGIEPGPHWWEASALTTAPALHPRVIKLFERDEVFVTKSKRSIHVIFPKVSFQSDLTDAVVTAIIN